MPINSGALHASDSSLRQLGPSWTSERPGKYLTLLSILVFIKVVSSYFPKILLVHLHKNYFFRYSSLASHTSFCGSYPQRTYSWESFSSVLGCTFVCDVSGKSIVSYREYRVSSSRARRFVQFVKARWWPSYTYGADESSPRCSELRLVT